MKPRKHHDVIVAWANGADVYMRKNASEKWKFTADPAFIADYEYCTELPREYPECVMTATELEAVWLGNYPNMGETTGRSLTECRRACADAVLRHAIDHGQVVTREEFDRAIGDRKARDMVVAQKVRFAARGLLSPFSQIAGLIDLMDLESIVAKVPK
jgi:hypothetical protein